CDRSRVPDVGFAGAGRQYGKRHAQGFVFPEGIYEGSAHIGNQLQIRVGDTGEAGDRRAIEELPDGEEVIIYGFGGDIKMVLAAEHVGKPDIYKDDVLVLYIRQNFFG